MATLHDTARSSSEPAQILMIQIGDETFALEAGIVREIIDPVPVTPVSGARPHLPALINMRGNVIPLADVRVRLGMPLTEADEDTRFVIIETEIEGEPVSLGIIADKVLEVTEIILAEAHEVPRLATRWRPEFVRHMVKWKGDFASVPEIKAILN